MNRILTSIKRLAEKLDGSPSAKEYRILQQFKDKFRKYEKELISQNFSLNYDAGFGAAAMAITRSGILMAHNYEKHYLASLWNRPKKPMECVEMFALMAPRKRVVIGLCSYHLLQKLENDSFDGFSLEDEPDLFVDHYGEVKFSDWRTPPADDEYLAELVSRMDTFLKNTEKGLYVTTLPAANSITELQKNVIPKLKSMHGALQQNGFKSVNW